MVWSHHCSWMLHRRACAVLLPAYCRCRMKFWSSLSATYRYEITPGMMFIIIIQCHLTTVADHAEMYGACKLSAGMWFAEMMCLQANSLASLSGVCRQLRLMCSSDELWKPLVQRDFSSTVFVDRRTGWKALYGAAVQYREQSRSERQSHARQPRLHPFHRGNPFVPAPPPGFILGVSPIWEFLQLMNKVDDKEQCGILTDSESCA